jgi:hypothetical protein
MATPIQGLGAEILLFLPKALTTAPKGMLPVDEGDALRIFDAWASDPANDAKVTAERLRLLKDGPLSVATHPQFKGLPEVVAADRAALHTAIAERRVLALSKEAVDLPPPAVPTGSTPPRFWGAVVVRDLTGTPLANLRVVGFWQEGIVAGEDSPELTTTGPSGVAVWSGTATDTAAKRATLNLRVLLDEGWAPCEATASGWREIPYQEIAVSTSLEAPAVQTVWVRCAPQLAKRFAWQHETLRHTFYPFRNVMLRSFLQAHHESELAERISLTPVELEIFREDAEDDLDALNAALDKNDAEAALELKSRLAELIMPGPKKKKSDPTRYVLRPDVDLAVAVRVLTRRWMASPAGPRRKGHRALLEQTLEALDARSHGEPVYPPWVRYQVVHFSGMLYATAHGSLGRPDTLIRFLRFGTPGKALAQEERWRKELGDRQPGFEIDRELAAASATQLFALALEAVGESAWYPERADGHAPTPSSTTTMVERLRLLLEATGSTIAPRRLDLQGRAQNLHKLLLELCAAGAHRAPEKVSGPIVASLRAQVSDLWQSTRSIDTWTKTLTGMFVEASEQDDWLAHLLHRRPADADGAPERAFFARFPDIEVWKAMAAYTPLRASHAPDIVATKYAKGDAWTLVFPSIDPSGDDASKGAWAAFLQRWRGVRDANKYSSTDTAVVDWRSYHRRTLEPIVRGVCNENNEMSYQTRGLMLSQGGGLRSNANMFFDIRDKGGAFGPVGGAASLKGYAPPVEVGDSVFVEDDVPYPPPPREEWNVIDPRQKHLLTPRHRGATEVYTFPKGGTVPLIHCVRGAPAPQMTPDLLHSPVNAEASGAAPAEGAPPPLASSGFGEVVPKWGHELVVIRRDDLLDRVLVHDTSLPTGIHVRTDLSGRLLAKFGAVQDAPERKRERARREAMIAATFVPEDASKLLAGCDDGEDPDVGTDPMKQYVDDKRLYIRPVLLAFGRLP